MTNLAPYPELQFFDNNGNILSGGTVGTYQPGTLTPVTTWQDINQVTANTNPIVLDSAGRCICFIAGQVRMIVSDANGDLIYDQLSVAGLPDSAVSAAMLPVVGAATTATALSLLGLPAYVATAVANIELLPGPGGSAGPTGPTGPSGPAGSAGPTGPGGLPSGWILAAGITSTSGAGNITVSYGVTFSGTPNVCATVVGASGGATIQVQPYGASCYFSSWDNSSPIGPIGFSWIATGPSA